MATNKQDKNKEAAKSDFFDYSDYLPAEAAPEQKQGRKIGGFIPIYAPDVAWADGDAAEQLPPVGGYLCHFEILPEKKRGKETYIPKMIKVIVGNKPTKGVAGAGDAKEVVDVPKGKPIMIPITGNLLYNTELLDAVADENVVHYATFRVVGQVDTGMPSPMWQWEVQLFDKITAKREGDFALPTGGSRLDRVLSEGKVPPGREVGRTADGQSYDRSTGEIRS